MSRARKGNYTEKRRRAMNNTHGRCQACRYRSKATSVHHVVPYRWFENKAEAHTQANLIPVCAKCHEILEKLYK